jgi:Na+-transporting NADH:ubiquinone oxidoreductase subunit NqrE
MKGLRKVILGLAFIGASTFLGCTGIKEHSELLGLATVIAAIATGVAALVYGNIKENQAEAAKNLPVTKAE